MRSTGLASANATTSRVKAAIESAGDSAQTLYFT